MEDLIINLVTGDYVGIVIIAVEVFSRSTSDRAMSVVFCKVKHSTTWCLWVSRRASIRKFQTE